MDMKRASVRTVAGETGVDHAIATLVLAFSTDPVVRWMYDDPHQYLRHIPRLFRALARPRSNQEECIVPATLLAWRYGLHRGFTLTMGRLRRLSEKLLPWGSRPTWARCSSERRTTDPKNLIGTCRSSASTYCTGAWDVVQRCCTMAFANAIGSTFRPTSGPPIG
jgi:hypothetical protein